jgi:hypothetical protein
VAVLHAVEGPLRGQRFPIPIKPKLIVGRYEVYDLIVPDPSISRKHFAFEVRADGLYLIDLGSLNGTQLNGLRVSTAKLEQGDRITAGQTVLVYDEADGSTPPIAIGDDDIDEIDDDIEVEELGDGDILEDGPISLGVTGPDRQTPRLGKPVAKVAGGHAARKSSRRQHGGDIGSRVTERLTTAKAPARASSGPSASGKTEPCAACARKVPAEEVAGGEGAKTRVGYVCGRCVEKRQRSGQKGSLEKFIRECQKRRK